MSEIPSNEAPVEISVETEQLQPSLVERCHELCALFPGNENASFVLTALANGWTDDRARAEFDKRELRRLQDRNAELELLISMGNNPAALRFGPGGNGNGTGCRPHGRF